MKGGDVWQRCGNNKEWNSHVFTVAFALYYLCGATGEKVQCRPCKGKAVKLFAVQCPWGLYTAVLHLASACVKCSVRVLGTVY